MIFADRKEEKKSLKENEINIISTYKNDPFVGHLSTPITSSKIARVYLNLLPIYIKELSPFLKGSIIGLFHGYFLFGPFSFLGPLRNTDAIYFLGFLASLSLLIILSTFALLYGYISFPKNTQKDLHSVFLDRQSWNKLISGFFLGGFTGVSLAYTITKAFFPIDF